MKLAAKYLDAIFEQEIPTGSIDGVNDEFTLSSNPNSNKAVMLFLNGLMLIQGSHYSISGQVITMASAPSIGQILYAFYPKGKQ
jgi:hypothetical protein